MELECKKKNGCHTNAIENLPNIEIHCIWHGRKEGSEGILGDFISTKEDCVEEPISHELSIERTKEGFYAVLLQHLSSNRFGTRSKGHLCFGLERIVSCK